MYLAVYVDRYGPSFGHDIPMITGFEVVTSTVQVEL